MPVSISPTPPSSSNRPNRWIWIDRTLAILAVVNLGLVVFDATYLQLRTTYLWGGSALEQVMTSDRERYLQQVDALYAVLTSQGLASPSVDRHLQTLQRLSQRLRSNAPIASRSSSTIAAIDEQLMARTGTTDGGIAAQTFWSRSYLTNRGWQAELAYFNETVRFFLLSDQPTLSYDLIKGIEPNRQTQTYLLTVDDLTVQLSQKGLDSPRVEPLLVELRRLSTQLIDQDPFQQAEKSGTLEQIKLRMKRHIYTIHDSDLKRAVPGLGLLNTIGLLDLIAPEILWADKSAKQAFNQFWSHDRLATAGWQSELAFFNRTIRPAMQTNYFRHVGTNDRPIDRFWLVDFPWIVLFLAEFLIRTWWLGRQRSEVTWQGAMIQRWYDVPLFLPFWHWLRIIPVLIRLDQLKFPNLAPLRARFKFSILTNFTEEMSQAVVARVLEQLQTTVQQGAIRRALLSPARQPKRAYVDANNTNEMQAIGDRLWQLLTCQVLPKIRPELEALLRYRIDKTFQNAGWYRLSQRIPGVRQMPNRAGDGVAAKIAELLSESLMQSYLHSKEQPPDPRVQELTQQVIDRLKTEFQTELTQSNALREIEFLVAELLEELKLNYLTTVPADTTVRAILSARSTGKILSDRPGSQP